MVRVSFRAPERLLKDVDALVDAGVYANRSEAFRDALRGMDGVAEPPTAAGHRVMADGQGDE